MKKILIVLTTALLIVSCSVNRDKEQQKIEQHEAALSSVDRLTANDETTEMLSLYRNYAKHFPDDSLAPVYLQRAADLSIALGATDAAVSLLDSVISLYPGFEDIGGCWFLKGYAYETAEMFDSARTAYTYFVDNYPEHSLAADTRRMIDYLGMSPEEMLEAILAKAENN
jgi:tetratricopeptide (TPR) repeat protein